MDEQETFPTKTERIDELFKKVQYLENRINILETTVQILKMESVKPTVFGPSSGHNPPRPEELDIPKVVYPKPFMQISKRKIEGSPYDLGSHGGLSKLRKK